MEALCYRDGQTPMHQASTWGQDTVVQCLLEAAADINAQVHALIVTLKVLSL